MKNQISKLVWYFFHFILTSELSRDRILSVKKNENPIEIEDIKKYINLLKGLFCEVAFEEDESRNQEAFDFSDILISLNK